MAMEMKNAVFQSGTFGIQSLNSSKSSSKCIRFTTIRPGFSIRKQSNGAASCSSGSGVYTEDDLDEFLQETRVAADVEAAGKDERPPRLCTLRAFRQEGEESVVATSVWSDTSSVLFRPLAANVQASAEARNFETLSGRLAMVAFLGALGIEYFTGNSVFKGVEVKEAAAVAAVCAVFVAGFAAAWGAKNRIGVNVSKGCQDLVESAITDILDVMFYEDEL